MCFIWAAFFRNIKDKTRFLYKLCVLWKLRSCLEMRALCTCICIGAFCINTEWHFASWSSFDNSVNSQVHKCTFEMNDVTRIWRQKGGSGGINLQAQRCRHNTNECLWRRRDRTLWKASWKKHEGEPIAVLRIYQRRCPKSYVWIPYWIEKESSTQCDTF